jgi:hypothetical protein
MVFLEGEDEGVPVVTRVVYAVESGSVDVGLEPLGIARKLDVNC